MFQIARLAYMAGGKDFMKTEILVFLDAKKKWYMCN